MCYRFDTKNLAAIFLAAFIFEGAAAAKTKVTRTDLVKVRTDYIKSAYGAVDNPDAVSIPVPCSPDNKDALLDEWIGLRKCSDYKKSVIDDLTAQVGTMLYNRYQGTMLDFNLTWDETDEKSNTTFCVAGRNLGVPVCPGANDTNELGQDCGMKGKGPDGYGKFSADPNPDPNATPSFSFGSSTPTSDPNSPDWRNFGKEIAWSLGLQAQALWRALQDTTEMVNTGTFTPASFPGADGKPMQPCKDFVTALQKLLTDRDETLGFFTVESRSNPSLYNKAVGLEHACPIRDIAKLTTDQLQKELKNIMSNQNDEVACLLMDARAKVEYLFEKMLACEVKYRMMPLAYKYSSIAVVLGSDDFKNNVLVPAQQYSVKQTTGHPERDPMTEFYKCYEGKSESGCKGVKQYFADIYALDELKTKDPIKLVKPEHLMRWMSFRALRSNITGAAYDTALSGSGNANVTYPDCKTMEAVPQSTSPVKFAHLRLIGARALAGAAGASPSPEPTPEPIR